jgi:SAM-dependent methyltransferase
MTRTISAQQKPSSREQKQREARKEQKSEERRARYELEKALANRLRESSPEERKGLYIAVYDEFFQRVSSLSHPQTSSRKEKRVEASQWRFLHRFLTRNTVFLEIGAGDCLTSLAAARIAKKVYALEVSKEITQRIDGPDNFELHLFDGLVIPHFPEKANVIYSNQVMEHLHPEDALEQLSAIYHALDEKGIYICVTPNRLTGPHDISRHFDPVPTGFHLKEYTNTDLAALFSKAGFSRVQAYAGAEGFYVRFPLLLLQKIESFLERLPQKPRRGLARFFLLYNVRLVGIK